MKYLLIDQHSARLDYRPLVEEDFRLWLPFFQSPEPSRYLFLPKATTAETRCRQWMDKVFDRYARGLGGMNVLIDRVTGAFVGQCGLLVQEVDGIEELEIGYSILPEFWNQGFATEAAIRCKEFAFDQDFAASLISIIHQDNIPSQHVASRNGMEFEKSTLFKGIPVNVYRVPAPQS